MPPVPKNATAGQITSQPCVYKTSTKEFAARCGFIYVPENRSKPGARLIALPYQRILAETRNPSEPLFELAGGPGQSNMASGLPVSWFVGKRDIVLLGYRGIDGTVRLDCPELDVAIRSGRTFLDQAGIARLGGAYRGCAARLTASGIDLSGYTALEVVDDIEALRRALGYDRIDLNSISYGTRLALIYGWRYPERVSRSAMIGVNPPGYFHWDVAAFDHQLRRYAELCAADAYCAARTSDLAGDIKRALVGMPHRWLGVPIHRDRVLIATFTALFSTNASAGVFDMWIAAAHGDYSGMALISVAYPYILPGGIVWGDHAAKAFSVDFEPGTACTPDMAPGPTLLGLPMNVFACAGQDNWPQHKIPAKYRSVRPSAVGTLMLGGSLDVSTPEENVRKKLLPVMPNARMVTVAEFAHFGDLGFAEAGATRQLLTAFYDDGRIDSSAFRYRPVKFDPGWMSFPLLAKIVVGTAFVLVALLAWLAAFVIRRWRRARAASN